MMEIEVTVTEASLADVVAVAYDHIEEQITTTTLGDVLVQALLDRLTTDPAWGDLAQRFAGAADAYLKAAAPGFLELVVQREVYRQLTDKDQTAMTRGKTSTRAEAIVAIEVTVQLREQFALAVRKALAGLDKQLDQLARESVQAFKAREGL